MIHRRIEPGQSSQAQVVGSQNGTAWKKGRVLEAAMQAWAEGEWKAGETGEALLM